MNLNEEFQIHDMLNPKVFDTAGQLLPDVKKAILQIVSQFEDEVPVDLNIVDVQVVGSNASYTYTDTSDIDVHIISNFDVLTHQKDLAQVIYDLARNKFNDKHTISIHGINVELTVQDVNSGCISNGIYSVLDNKWVKEPKPLKSASKKNVEKELEAWRMHIAQVLADQNEEEVLNSINTLYLIRHNSIAADGEMGAGNQLFKEIRSQGLLERLKEEYTRLVDKRLTLEHLGEQGYTKGQLVERIEG